VDRDAIDGNTAVMGAGSANDAAQAFLVEAYRTRRRRPGRTAEHPIAVSQLLADDGQPAIVVVAGLLHDVLEDTDV
jgi:(p)ppGpp synthase/HD superfamily hydrolase